MNPLRSKIVFEDTQMMLVAIERITLHDNKTDTIRVLHGNLQPMAVIVCSPGKVDAFDMSANRVELAQLARDLPELNRMIAPFIRGG